MPFDRTLLPDPVTYFENQGLTLKGPRSAKWKTTVCNFHGGSDSMRVNVATGAWVCMSCGEKGGDVLAYEIKDGGREFVDAAKALGCWVDDGRPQVQTKCFASVGQCAGAQIWSRLACASCWISRRLRLGLAPGMRGSCGARPLRPPASLLHNAALPSVPASRCAKAPLGAGHRFAPCRVKATGVMQSGLRWSRSHSRRRSPVVGTPYAPPSARPCGCCGAVASVRRCAHCSGQWPAASYLVCAPPTLWPRRCAALALRTGLPVRPQGAPSAQRLGSRRLTAAGRQPQICGANPCTCGGIAQV